MSAVPRLVSAHFSAERTTWFRSAMHLFHIPYRIEIYNQAIERKKKVETDFKKFTFRPE